MSTTRSFQAMLNEYLPDTLLKEELVKRSYFIQKVEKDDGWKGGNLIVPFRGTQASSVKFGGLTGQTDIAQSKYVRGQISSYREVWSSLILNQTDLLQHDGKIPETTFLRLIPDEAEALMDYTKMVMSIQMTSGPHMSVVTDDTNRATGVMVVSHIDRFYLDQHLLIDDNNSAALDVYVIAIDVNGSTTGGSVTFSATRGGAFVDLSAYTVAQGAKLYYDGSTDGAGNFDTYVSIRRALLSAANGGDSTIHGVSKLAYPFLQAVNIDGASITATNILDKLFDAYVAVRSKAKGMASEFLMSYKHWGSVMKSLESQKGAFRTASAPEANQYGWTTVTVASTTTGQTLTITGIQEMDDDIIALMDWKSVTFRSNGFVRKRTAPDGKQYFEIRNTTGYAYVIDLCCFGELEWSKPGQSAIIYNISY